MSGSHVLVSTDWELLPARWAAHMCSSVQTEGCYPQDEWLTYAPQHRLRVVIRKMSGSHVLVSADRGLLPARWAAHMCSSVQTEGCYPWDEWLTHALHCRLRVVICKMSGSHMLISTDRGSPPTRWVAHKYSSVQTEGCYPQDEWLTCAHQHRPRVATHKMSSSQVLFSADWGLLPARWVTHMCLSAQTEGRHP